MEKLRGDKSRRKVTLDVWAYHREAIAACSGWYQSCSTYGREGENKDVFNSNSVIFIWSNFKCERNAHEQRR